MLLYQSIIIGQKSALHGIVHFVFGVIKIVISSAITTACGGLPGIVLGIGAYTILDTVLNFVEEKYF